MPLRYPLVAALLAASLAGCMKNGLERVTRFVPGSEPVARLAPAASLYKVKYADANGGGLKPVPGAARPVDRGQPLGFRTADDGTLLAIAGDETFPIDAPVDQVHHLVWVRRYKRPRQFAVEAGRVAQGTVEGAGFLAGKALEAGVSAALHTDDNDGEDNDNNAGPWLWGGGDDNHPSHHHDGGGGSHHGGQAGGGSKPPKPTHDDSAKPVRVGARNP